MDSTDLPEDLQRLILDHVDSVPHLEALMLLWENSARAWGVAELGARIYASPEAAGAILRDLQRKNLVTAAPADADKFVLSEVAPDRETARRITEAYRKNVARVASLLHAQGSQSVREFARAFTIKGKK